MLNCVERYPVEASKTYVYFDALFALLSTPNAHLWLPVLSYFLFIVQYIYVSSLSS
jgi:hypothetical protein